MRRDELAAERVARHRAMRLISSTNDALLTYALRKYPGTDTLEVAWQRFPGNPEPDTTFDAESAWAPFYLGWFVQRWRPESGAEVAALTVAEHMLSFAKYHLSREQRAFIEVLVATPFSLWEIHELQPGRGVGLLNSLTGEARFVLDADLSTAAHAGAALCTQVVEIRGRRFVGVMPGAPIDDTAAREIAKELRGAADATPEELERRILEGYAAAARGEEASAISGIESQEGDQETALEDTATLDPEDEDE